MRYISLFSGIEAASVAWHPLGWEPVAFAEIEPFPSAVLAHRFPDVPNLGDITRVDWSAYRDAGVDVLVGGSPCQSFSVAGLRKGLADPRGNLALEYLRAVDAVRPRWVVWENVPGVLSADGGRAFGTFLGGLAELGYGFAYRVLDAQYVRVESHSRAVPQRRRRVFVVGCLGDVGRPTDPGAVQDDQGAWRLPAAVLLEHESLRGHTPPRREAGKGTAGDVAGSLGRRGTRSHTELDGHGAYIPEVSNALCANDYKGSKAEKGLGPPLIPEVAQSVTAVSSRTYDSAGTHGTGPVNLIPEVAHSLRADGFDASEDGTGRGTPIVMAPAFSKRPGQQIATRDDGSSFALTTGEPPRGLAAAPAVDYSACKWYDTLQKYCLWQGNNDASTQEANAGAVLPDVREEVGTQATPERRPGVPDPLQQAPILRSRVLGEPRDTARGRSLLDDGALPCSEGVSAGTLRCLREPEADGRSPQGSRLAEQRPCESHAAVSELPHQGPPPYAVRRLTPLEAERLQGFPDGWTDVPYRGKQAADGPRYKAIGNSMAVNVMAFIGARIQAVDDVAPLTDEV